MLVEAVVSIFLLAIALSMTVIIVGVLTKNVANTTNTGTSADAVQSELLDLESYVSGVVSPTGAAEASLQASTVSSTCWGSNPVTSEQANGVAAMSPATVDGWDSTNDTPSLNQSIGIIYARDFSMIYCGYSSDTSSTTLEAPNVYEIYVNTSSGSCTANNYCLLQVVDLTYNPATQASTTYSTNDYPAIRHRRCLLRSRRSSRQSWRPWAGSGVTRHASSSGSRAARSTRRCLSASRYLPTIWLFARPDTPGLSRCSTTTRAPGWARLRADP